MTGRILRRTRATSLAAGLATGLVFFGLTWVSVGLGSLSTELVYFVAALGLGLLSGLAQSLLTQRAFEALLSEAEPLSSHGEPSSSSDRLPETAGSEAELVAAPRSGAEAFDRAERAAGEEVQEIGAVFERLSAGVVESSEAAGELLGEVERISSGIGRVAKDTRQASEMAHQLSDDLADLECSVTDSRSQLAEVQRDSQRVADSSEELSSQSQDALAAAREAFGVLEQGRGAISALDAASQGVSESTAAIEKFSKQTKLLALNATIEAASAGEFGKGFAVVASEVRTLAEQTRELTGKINESLAALHEANQGVGLAFNQLGEWMDRTQELMGHIGSETHRQGDDNRRHAEAIAKVAEQFAAVEETVQENLWRLANIDEALGKTATWSGEMAESTQGSLQRAGAINEALVELREVSAESLSRSEALAGSIQELCRSKEALGLSS